MAWISSSNFIFVFEICLGGAVDISEATKKYFHESSYPPMVKIIRTLLACVNLLALFSPFPVYVMFVKRFNCLWF